MPTFDDQLTQAAPPSPALDDRVRHELALLVRSTRHHARRRTRHPLRWAAAGLVVTAVVGGGAATAAGLLPWYATAPTAQVTTSEGSTCELTVGIKEVEVIGRPVSSSARLAAVAEAERCVADLDLTGLDPGSPDLMTTLQHGLDAHLRRQGLPTQATGIALATTCGVAG